jgi:hypothetical protein
VHGLAHRRTGGDAVHVGGKPGIAREIETGQTAPAGDGEQVSIGDGERRPEQV